MASPPINFGGLASGLDTQSLINAIMQVERRPLQRLQQRQTQLSQQQQGLDEMRGKLDAFASALRGMSNKLTFDAYRAKASDESRALATAGAGAESGLYSVEILELAAAHKVMSGGVAAPDQGIVADGTITVRSGSKDAITIDVSAAAGNNSLEAIRDAINGADRGVQASVLFDGTNYRLVVRAKETGTANALTLSDTTGLGLGSPAAAVTQAADARVKIDGITVTSGSNHVTGVIPGVILDLRSKTVAGQPISVEVTADTEKVTGAVNSLVAAYNDALSFFNTQFDKNKPGVLALDPTARSLQTGLQSLVTGGVDGIPEGGIRSLSAIGVSFDGKTGLMSLDGAALSSLMGTRFDEVSRLFTASGTATNARIQYLSSASSTAAGSYEVAVTRAAEQATVSGAQALGATLGRDETLSITVGGSTVSAALTAAMTPSQVVDALNAALRGAGATASLDGGRLRIASREFGSAANVTVASNVADPAAGTGFGSTAATDAGVDVAGSIGGVEATGIGQALSAADGSPAAGLSLRVTATAADVAASIGGSFGSISYSPGLVKKLSGAIDAMTSASGGAIASARDAMADQLKTLADDAVRLQDRLDRRQARLLTQFSAAEKAIAALQAQQSQITNGIR